MSTEFPCRVLLIGPPASGKSTLARLLSGAHPAKPAPCNFDDTVLALARERGCAGPLPDALIDEAVDRFLAGLPRGNVLVELPHHDYLGLIDRGRLELEQFDAVVLLRARLHDLLARDAKRVLHVPANYVARCLGSAAALAEWLELHQQDGWLSINTTVLTTVQQAALVLDFLRQHSSPSLRKLVVAPCPARTDFGGNLRGDVEWDERLARWLVERYRVRTVLDVGCGAGLTLPLFAELGATAYGLDGYAGMLDQCPRFAHRLLIADLTRQRVEWPTRVDLVWCVEVLEHIPASFEQNVIRTIADNAGVAAFVSAAPQGQTGYHHVNLRPREEWLDRFEHEGLRLVEEGDSFLKTLDEHGSFGKNFLRANGMVLSRDGR